MKSPPLIVLGSVFLLALSSAVVVADIDDIDNDGIADSIDTDRDGDGVLDQNDDFPRDPHGVRDTDGDNISNAFEHQLGFAVDDANNTPNDYDNDGWPDVLDPDMDNDGYENEKDAFPLLAS